MNQLKTGYRICFMAVLCCMLLLMAGCEKEVKETNDPVFETGTVTDVEGNVYQTVKIGNRWWMAENLKTTRFRDGSEIPYVSRFQNATWDTIQSSACSRYEDNEQAPGLLYNAYTLTDSRGLAPEGWRIPTDEEWKEMERHLGMNDADATGWRGTDEGDKLKVKAPEGWTRFGTVWGNNQSGFSALAGSCRLHNGTFGQPGLKQTGFWWTSTFTGNGDAWYRYLDYKKSQVFRSHTFPSYGMSVRCIKD